jgi:hypothetical protein
MSHIRKPTYLLFGVFLLYYFQTALAAVAGLNLTAIIPHAITIGFIIVGFGFVKLNRSNLRYIVASLVIAFLVALLTNARDAAWYLYLAFSYMAIWKAFESKYLDFRIFDKIIFVCAILCVAWIGLGFAAARVQEVGLSSGNTLAFIPTGENEWRINIGPPGSTIHFIATLAGMAVIISFYRVLVLRQPANFLALIIYGYLLVFSGARSVGLGVVCGVLIIGIGRFKLRFLPHICYFFVSVGLIVVYGADLVAMLLPQTDELGGNLLKSGNADITSGRLWLWGYHLSLFKANIFGAGSDSLRGLVVGELASDGEVVGAVAESFYTYLLAVYGIFAIPIFALHLRVLHGVAKAGDILKSAVLVMAIISTAASSIFGGAYGAAIALLIPFLAVKGMIDFKPPRKGRRNALSVP